MMFKKEIKFIYDFNLNKIKRLGPYFTYDKLLNSGIHPAIMQYISGEIDFLIYEDRQKVLKNSIFDYSGERISELFYDIGEEIKGNKRFSIDYIAKLMLHGSSFIVNYLVRPRWTMIKFIFDEHEHKHTSEIKQTLNYIYYYGYLKRILTQYLNRKKILSINVREFEEILDKIDKLGTESNNSVIIDNALKSIADFFNIGSTNKRDIPIQAVEMFLEEKNLDAHLKKLKSNFPDDDKLKFDINDIRLVLADVESDVAEPEPEEEGNEISGEPENLIEEPVDEISEDVENEIEEDETVEEIVEPEPEEKGLKVKIALPEDDYSGSEIIEVDSDKEDYIEDITDEEETEEVSEVEIDNELDELEKIEIIDKISDEDEEILDTEEVSVEDSDDTSEEAPDEIEEEIIEDEEEDATLFDGEELSDEEKFDDEEIIEEENQSVENQEEETKSDVEEEQVKTKPRKLEISELLERKNMTKVIEVIFDYDIEEFAVTIEDACNANNKQEAFMLLHELYDKNHIEPASKEAVTLNTVISEFFDHTEK